MMKIVQLLSVFLSGMILALLIYGCGGAPEALYEGMLPEFEHFTSTEIPLEVERGMPYITIDIETEKFELLFDTGANSVTIALSPESVDDLNVRHVGRPRFLKNNDGLTMYRKFVLEEVTLGGLRYGKLLCDKVTSSVLEHFDVELKGLIGLALLKEFNVLVDYKERKVELFRNDIYPKQDNIAAWQKIPFIVSEDGILVKGTIQGGDRELIVADESIPHLNFVFVDSFEKPSSLDGGMLGYDFFLKHKVFFDFGNANMYIKRQVHS